MLYLAERKEAEGRYIVVEGALGTVSISNCTDAAGGDFESFLILGNSGLVFA
jgi:hypothetical protein